MLAINISYESRTAIKDIVDKINKKNEYDASNEKEECDILIFDNCLMEVSRVLQDSWFRFKHKETV